MARGRRRATAGGNRTKATTAGGNRTQATTAHPNRTEATPKSARARWYDLASASPSEGTGTSRADCRSRRDARWGCYLLATTDNRYTYVGATVDMPRRYRQHIGLLSGGARATSRRSMWRVSMFAIVPNKTLALRFEWRAKRARGLVSRRTNFVRLCSEVGARCVDYDALRAQINSRPLSKTLRTSSV